MSANLEKIKKLTQTLNVRELLHEQIIQELPVPLAVCDHVGNICVSNELFRSKYNCNHIDELGHNGVIAQNNISTLFGNYTVMVFM